MQNSAFIVPKMTYLKKKKFLHVGTGTKLFEEPTINNKVATPWFPKYRGVAHLEKSIQSPGYQVPGSQFPVSVNLQAYATGFKVTL